MGIPKFYRWLSERYPAINQRIYDQTFLPGVDNLYLDMNGILHNCSHANGSGIGAKSDKDVLQAVFFYLDRIVHIVKPEKLLYMAIDGVAPRAKMNQQRSRRFRSAKDAAQLAVEARQRGEEVPPDAFDSNCITPGTEWMARVSANIKYFIKRKIKEDPIWRRFKVIFSGHEVPGEGEHKIIGYIRNMKMQRGYDPNTRHVMYGLDADLVMLALVSHDPHFSLLREVVDFNSFRRKENSTKELKKQIYHDAWQLLHISTLREYLDLEFSNVKFEGFKYDLERVIDDVILLCIFVGNDFLPHLPSLDIAESAIDVMFTMYKQELPTMGGYLTNSGNININRLERIMVLLGNREEGVFTERLKTIDKQNARNKKNARYNRGGTSRPNTVVPEWLSNSASTDVNATNATKIAYYNEKFGLNTGEGSTKDDQMCHGRIVKAYLEGLEWVLQYYYHGVCSWNWFYPFHYAPMASDMVNLGPLHSTIRFTLGKPFIPFYQLLGCLPPASSQFLPQSFRALMTRDDSPIIDFYPNDFQIDMNGKRNPWEGVNLLSFINEKRLKEAVANHAPNSTLTDEEIARNSHGKDYLYQYDVSIQDTAVAQHGNKEAFPDVVACQCKVSVFTLPPIRTANGKFVARLCRGVKVPSPGYPCLRAYDTMDTTLQAVELNVFGFPSRKATLLLKPQRPTESEKAAGGTTVDEDGDVDVDLDKASEALLGRKCFIGFPHLREALVVSVCDGYDEYQQMDDGTIRKKSITGDNKQQWRQLAAGLGQTMLSGAGEPGTGGLDIGNVIITVNVRPIVTMNRDSTTGATTQVFQDAAITFPLQCIFLTNPALDPRFQEAAAQTVVERFPKNTGVVYIGQQKYKEISMYGSTGFVRSQNAEKNTVDVTISLEPKEKPFGKIIAQKVKEKYFNVRTAAKALGVTPSALGRIMGSLIVMPGRVDIGLNLKVRGNLCLPGYARPIKAPINNGANNNNNNSQSNSWNSNKESAKLLFLGQGEGEGKSNTNSMARDGSQRVQWEYSERAIQLVSTYKRKFKRVFTTLLAKPNESRFSKSDIAPNGEDFEKICRWLQQLSIYKMPLVPASSETLSNTAIAAIQEYSDKQRALSIQQRTTIDINGIPATELYKPDFEGFANSGQGPGTDLNKAPSLGDRIVNIRCTNMPLGLRGTVVSIHPSTSCVEVVMDAEFIGGQNLNGLCKKGRGRLVKWSEVLSLSKVEVIKAPKPQPKVAKKAPVAKKQAWKKPEAKKQQVGKKKKAPSKAKKKSTGVQKNGVAPAANDGLTQLLQNAKLSNNNNNAQKSSENKDNGNLKALLTKEGIIPAGQQQQQQMPRPMIVPPSRGVPPPMLVSRGMPRMMPRMMPGMPMPRMMPGMQMPPMFVVPPRPMMQMPRGPSVGILPMGPTIEVKKREDKKNEPEKRVKREKKKASSSLKPSHV
jgi:5'-3' exoribonuclease 1